MNRREFMAATGTALGATAGQTSIALEANEAAGNVKCVEPYELFVSERWYRSKYVPICSFSDPRFYFYGITSKDRSGGACARSMIYFQDNILSLDAKCYLEVPFNEKTFAGRSAAIMTCNFKRQLNEMAEKLLMGASAVCSTRPLTGKVLRATVNGYTFSVQVDSNPCVMPFLSEVVDSLLPTTINPENPPFKVNGADLHWDERYVGLGILDVEFLSVVKN